MFTIGTEIEIKFCRNKVHMYHNIMSYSHLITWNNYDTSKRHIELISYACMLEI